MELDDDGRQVYSTTGMRGWKGHPYNLLGFLSASIWLVESYPEFDYPRRFEHNLQYVLQHLDSES